MWHGASCQAVADRAGQLRVFPSCSLSFSTAAGPTPCRRDVRGPAGSGRVQPGRRQLANTGTEKVCVLTIEPSTGAQVTPCSVLGARSRAQLGSQGLRGSATYTLPAYACLRPHALRCQWTNLGVYGDEARRAGRAPWPQGRLSRHAGWLPFICGGRSDGRCLRVAKSNLLRGPRIFELCVQSYVGSTCACNKDIFGPSGSAMQYLQYFYTAHTTALLAGRVCPCCTHKS